VAKRHEFIKSINERFFYFSNALLFFKKFSLEMPSKKGRRGMLRKVGGGVLGTAKQLGKKELMRTGKKVGLGVLAAHDPALAAGALTAHHMYKAHKKQEKKRTKKRKLKKLEKKAI
jgi:hypothetical protein